MSGQFKNIRKSTRLVILFAAIVAALTTCMQNEKKETATPERKQEIEIKKTYYSDYAGSEKCGSCHKAEFNSFAHTSHFHSTMPANEQTIKGSFKKGKNIFTYNPQLYMAMEKRDSGLFQVVYYRGEEKIALPFDLTIGSGTKGQSFMYWHGNRLFQLPMTYFTIAGQWANSPGFPVKVQYERPITSRCLECHSTFANVTSPWPQEPETFDRNKIIYGVGCEKCHGPGAMHIAFHEQHPDIKQAMYIQNPAHFSRQQSLDLCALCHGGRKQKTQPSFSFIAGDTLNHFFTTDPSAPPSDNPAMVDVHGNQVGLLMSSKCFIRSNTMTCTTCHDAHSSERGNNQVFTTRCQNCHQQQHKPIPGAESITAAAIKTNCINCHMPEFPSRSITLYTSGMEAPKAALFRTHLISVYPEVTKKMLGDMRNK